MTVVEWVTARWHESKDTTESGVSIQSPEVLDPAADTVAALSALASFQQITQQLDGKVNTLIGVHLALVALVVNRLSGLLTPWPEGGLGRPLAGLSVILLIAAGVTGYLILSAFRPRTAQYATYNHWALPGSAGQRPMERPTASELASEAWLAAHAVGDIAVTKNGCVRRASASLLVTIGLVLAWLVLLP